MDSHVRDWMFEFSKGEGVGFVSCNLGFVSTYSELGGLGLSETLLFVFLFEIAPLKCFS